MRQEQSHPAFSWILDQSFVDCSQTARQSSSQALCTRVHGSLEGTDIDIHNLATRRISSVESWRMVTLSCDLELLQHSKSSILPQEFRHHALERLARYTEYRPFFTDGSKRDDGVACAFVSLTTTIRCRLPDTASAFSSELYAIYQVLKHVRRRSYNRCLIITD